MLCVIEITCYAYSSTGFDWPPVFECIFHLSGDVVLEMYSNEFCLVKAGVDSPQSIASNLSF